MLDMHQCSIFQPCTAEELALLKSNLPPRRYEAGQLMIKAGESAEEMFVLLAGTAEVQMQGEGANTLRIDVLTAGMTVGEMAFLDGSPRSANVVATDTVECLVINRTWFTALSDTRPSLKITLLQELMREISARLRQANVEISALHRS